MRAERRYCVTRKELLALMYFVKYFRHYLYGREFIIRTDHGSLRWLMNFKNPEGQVARWLEVLSTYIFTVEHRYLHGNADSLSRKPVSQCEDGIDDNKEHNNDKNDHETKCFQLSITESEDDDRDLIKLQQEDEYLAMVRTWVKQRKTILQGSCSL